jgi:hypothetical protein
MAVSRHQKIVPIGKRTLNNKTPNVMWAAKIRSAA